MSKIDEVNSTNTVLSANSTFTGESIGVIGYTSVNLNVESDQNSASGGIQIWATNSLLLHSLYNISKTYLPLNDLSKSFNQECQITSDINNVCDIFVITCESIEGGSNKLFASLTWQEIS